MDPGASNLEQQVEELRSRVLRLESALGQRGLIPQEPVARTAPPTAAPVAYSAADYRAYSASAPAQLPLPASIPAQAGFNPHSPDLRVEQHSLESRIATHWFNRIGILAVFIGSAWFLKLAIDNNWIGPAVRVLLGLVVGTGIIAWSERFQRKGYPAFGYSLKAVGSSILYLSLWAAFAVFHMVPAGTAFAGMVAVTAFNGLFAWRHDAELLALYAIVGGMSTPLLLSTGENHEAALFVYLLTLDFAVLILGIARPWSRLLSAAFLGTSLFIAAWWSEYYSDLEASETAAFVIAFFLLFALTPRFARPRDANTLLSWDKLAFAVLPVFNAALAFAALFEIYANGHDSSSFIEHDASVGALLALCFALFYLAMLWPLQKDRHGEADGLLSSVHLTLAVVFFSIALPLETHGRWLTVGWLIEGAALLFVASRRRLLLLRHLAILCLLLGLLLLLVPSDVDVTTAIWNRRFATYAVGICVFAFVTWIAQKTREIPMPRPAALCPGTESPRPQASLPTASSSSPSVGRSTTTGATRAIGPPLCPPASCVTTPFTRSSATPHSS